jgi:MFS transporter, DHA2 family, multidrug resistance protein
MMLFVVGLLLSRGIDARWLIGVGLIIMGIGNYWMSRMNLDIGPWQVVWPRVVVIAGLSMIFAPLNVAAYLDTPKELRGAAVGLLSLLRNEEGVWALRWPRRFTNDSTNSTLCVWGSTSTPSTRP